MWIKVFVEPLLRTWPLDIYCWFFKTVDSLYDSLKVGEVVISILILWKLSHFHRDGKLQVSGSKLCASCLCTSRLITLYPLPLGQTLHFHFPWTLEMVQCPIWPERRRADTLLPYGIEKSSVITSTLLGMKGSVRVCNIPFWCVLFLECHDDYIGWSIPKFWRALNPVLEWVLGWKKKNLKHM